MSTGKDSGPLADTTTGVWIGIMVREIYFITEDIILCTKGNEIGCFQLRLQTQFFPQARHIEIFLATFFLKIGDFYIRFIF